MSSAFASSGPADCAPLLEIRNLDIWFDTEQGRVHAVRGVSFDVPAGRTLGIVGESGCGKSVTCHAILRLTPGNGSMAGEILFDGRNLAAGGEERLAGVRGREIAMIFQEPLSALNPVHTIGAQIAESLRLHRGMDPRAARAEVLRLLERVGIPEARRRMGEYPHQLSGGMNQRAMIAMALACRPRLLIADEPTTALDVTIQAQILGLLQELQREFAMAIVLVTHDLGVVAESADEVAVMYAGSVVEQGAATDIFARPLHPYTAGLLQAIPRIDATIEALTPIEGTVPSAMAIPRGCSFAPRCRYARELCREVAPTLRAAGTRRALACHFPLDATGAAA
ncbi:MAG: ABC transporter ATP-binding protein [Betaproteobacteria bacterium]|nr:MAG: ABC transporter ATP-binding protein [Betaproteobacteria bacterium]